MNSEMIMTITTMIVSLVLGIIAKKVPWISNNLIHIQNLIIKIILSIIYYVMTKNFSIAIASAGIIVGGTYDLIKNTKLLIDQKKQMRKEIIYNELFNIPFKDYEYNSDL